MKFDYKKLLGYALVGATGLLLGVVLLLQLVFEWIPLLRYHLARYSIRFGMEWLYCRSFGPYPETVDLVQLVGLWVLGFITCIVWLAVGQPNRIRKATLEEGEH